MEFRPLTKEELEKGGVGGWVSLEGHCTIFLSGPLTLRLLHSNHGSPYRIQENRYVVCEIISKELLMAFVARGLMEELADVPDTPKRHIIFDAASRYLQAVGAVTCGANSTFLNSHYIHNVTVGMVDSWAAKRRASEI